MIEALRSDDIVDKVGGKFMLTALVHRRLGQLMDGARPLVPRGNMTPIELVMEEIMQDKIVFREEAPGESAEDDGESTL